MNANRKRLTADKKRISSKKKARDCSEDELLLSPEMKPFKKTQRPSRATSINVQSVKELKTKFDQKVKELENDCATKRQALYKGTKSTSSKLEKKIHEECSNTSHLLEEVRKNAESFLAEAEEDLQGVKKATAKLSSKLQTSQKLFRKRIEDLRVNFESQLDVMKNRYKNLV